MGNYKLVSRQLQNSRELQNNSANSAMLITINLVIKIKTKTFKINCHIGPWSNSKTIKERGLKRFPQIQTNQNLHSNFIIAVLIQPNLT